MACFPLQVNAGFKVVIFFPDMSPITLRLLGFSFEELPEVKSNWTSSR